MTGLILMEGEQSGTASSHKFLNYVLEKCDVDEISGQFKCKKCGVIVFLDWFEKEVEDCMCDD